MHLVGVVHGSPTNPTTVHEVAAEVRPDAFALEGTEEMLEKLRRAAGSAQLQPLIDKVRTGRLSCHATSAGRVEEGARWIHLQPLLSNVRRGPRCDFGESGPRLSSLDP